MKFYSDIKQASREEGGKGREAWERLQRRMRKLPAADGDVHSIVGS